MILERLANSTLFEIVFCFLAYLISFVFFVVLLELKDAISIEEIPLSD